MWARLCVWVWVCVFDPYTRNYATRIYLTLEIINNNYNMLHTRYCIIDALMHQQHDLPRGSLTFEYYILYIYPGLMHNEAGRERYSGVCVILVATKWIKMQSVNIQ